MAQVTLAFPDGSSRPFEAGTTGAQVAASISNSLAKNAVAMMLDQEVKDLADPIDHDGAIRILTRKDAEALPLIRQLRPDLIVADISLKSSNGLELVKVVRAEMPETPLLIMSMHDELIWAEVALRAGAQGYLMKESSIEHLVDAIRQILGGKLYLSLAATHRIIQGRISGERAASRRDDSPS